ncbi:MAG: MFS transporter, partial [Agathobacter sp.]|nr:MFS transporter [Agathobacter sp.]
MEKKITNTRIGIMNWILIWVVGLAGQLCWNVENQWFNTFIYAKIGPYAWIISWMTAISSIVTTFSTFYFGTLSDRAGKRRPFIFVGYVLWGIFTILFGVSEFLPKNELVAAAVMIVAMDALMSFFGSMGNDAAFSSWTTDISNEKNRGQIGAALAALPIIATIAGTVVSGILIKLLDYFTFFIIMGVSVVLIGTVGFLLMKEGEGLVPNRDEKGFWHQFFSVFNFKNIKENKELFCVLLISCVYFICFNFYYAHIGNYFIHTLGYDEGMSGIIQGVGLGLAIFATLPAIRL